LADRQLLLMRRTGDRAIDIGEAPAVFLVPGPDFWRRVFGLVAHGSTSSVDRERADFFRFRQRGREFTPPRWGLYAVAFAFRRAPMRTSVPMLRKPASIRAQLAGSGTPPPALDTGSM